MLGPEASKPEVNTNTNIPIYGPIQRKKKVVAQRFILENMGDYTTQTLQKYRHNHLWGLSVLTGPLDLSPPGSSLHHDHGFSPVGQNTLQQFATLFNTLKQLTGTNNTVQHLKHFTAFYSTLQHLIKQYSTLQYF